MKCCNHAYKNRTQTLTPCDDVSGVMQVNSESPGAKGIHALSEHMNYVSTLNYDYFLETVLKRSARPHFTEPDRDHLKLRKFSPMEAYVYHLHGVCMGVRDNAPVAIEGDYTLRTSSMFRRVRSQRMLQCTGVIAWATYL